MLKKILPLGLLAALVAWGVYDYTQKSDESKSQEDKEQAAAQTESEEEQTKETGVEEGNEAPDFTLQSLEGKPVKLSDFRGKKVIVNFWATWCPPCRAEMPEMQSYYKDHKDNDFTILGVDLTSTEKKKSDVEPFVKEFGVAFPIVLDKEGDVASTYQITGYPTSYFIDKQGVIQFKLVGAMNKDIIHDAIGKMD